MMPRSFVLLTLLFCAGKAVSQPYKYVYYFDNNYNTAEQSVSTVTGKGYEDNGAFKVDFYSKATNQLLLSATYKDSTLGALHGMFRSYFSNLTTEVSGNYVNNEMDGVWQYWNTGGRKTDSIIYKNGVKTAYASYIYAYRGTDIIDAKTLQPISQREYYPVRYSFTDSLNNTFYEKIFSQTAGHNGAVDYEVNFTGQRGFLKEYDSTGALKKTDSVFNRTFKEAGFPGGDAAWRVFMQQNLNSLVAVNNGAHEGTYTVIVRFIINTDGTLSNIEAESDPGYGMGKEAIRVISQSPKWTPAIQYGKYVKSYRRQPITFSLDSN